MTSTSASMTSACNTDPTFQGLGAAWGDGEQIYAEVTLGEAQRQEAGRYAIHPALLDAALHAIALFEPGPAEQLQLPFAWSGLDLQGAGAVELRVRLTRGKDGYAIALADGQGMPIASADALTMRAADPAQLGAAAQGRDGLLGIEWTEVGLGDPVSFEEVEAPASSPRRRAPSFPRSRSGAFEPQAGEGEPAGAARRQPREPWG